MEQNITIIYIPKTLHRHKFSRVSMHMHKIIHTHPAKSGCLSPFVCCRMSVHFRKANILYFSFYNIALIKASNVLPSVWDRWGASEASTLVKPSTYTKVQ